jgi:hypothetical protein
MLECRSDGNRRYAMHTEAKLRADLHACNGTLSTPSSCMRCMVPDDAGEETTQRLRTSARPQRTEFDSAWGLRRQSFVWRAAQHGPLLESGAFCMQAISIPSFIPRACNQHANMGVCKRAEQDIHATDLFR